MKVIQKRNVLLQALNPTFIDMTWLIVTLLALILLWLILIAHEFPIQGKFISVDRSCHLEVFRKKVLLKISQKSQENACARVSVLIKLQNWGLRLWPRRFPVNFVKFSRTPFSGGYSAVDSSECLAPLK